VASAKRDIALAKYKPEYAQMCRDHIAAGWSFGSFAGIIGVSNEIMYFWKMDYPEFKAAAEMYSNRDIKWFNRSLISVACRK
jgi:hypothetical protein